MADFGEALPFETMIENGVLGEQFSNAYPEEWAKLNKEILEDEGFFFVRQGFSEKPRVCFELLVRGSIIKLGCI